MNSDSSNIEKEIEQHLNWVSSLLATEDSTITNSAIENQINDLISSIQTPVDERQPKVSDVCEQYSGLAKQAYQAPEEPSPIAEEPKEEAQYRISDHGDYSDDFDDGDIYNDNLTSIHGQTIPEWAQKENLLKELKKQQSVDPDKIFPNFESTCDLSEMFDKKKRTFKVRGDSGWWAVDGVTSDEITKYNKTVGITQ